MTGKRIGPAEAPQLPQGPDNQQQTVAHHRKQYSTKLASALPVEMLGLPQFVCHRAKAPYNPNTGAKASPTDSETWGTFTEARRAYERGGYDGIGFVFAEDAGIAGVDLDKCRDKETGQLADWAARIVERFAPCYVEVSPSGTGLHLLLLGMLPENGRRRMGQIEMYDGGRYFTVTGDTLTGAVQTLEPRQEALDALYAELFPSKPERPQKRVETPAAPLALDDQALLAKASNPTTSAGRDFAALWAGDASAYRDEKHPDGNLSVADYHLARMLAWWARHDVPRIERLMRSSGLARDKWDTRRGGSTYLAQTIDRAVLWLGTRMYSGAKGDSMPEQDATASDDAPEQETTGTTASKSANDCCAQKDKIIAHLQRELQKKQARIDELEAAQRWEKKARRNKDISATTKAVARSAIEFYQQSKPIEGQPNHLRKLWYEKIAAASGVSESTVKTEMDKLSAWGGGEKKTVRVTSEKTGKRVDRVIWAPSPVLLERPELLKPEKPRNHGGKRECPGCGSKHLRIRSHHYLTCMECGQRWEEETAERILRGDEAEMAARADNMPLDDGFSGEQDATANAETPAEDYPLVSVQIETGQSSPRETATKLGLNHHDERAALLALVDVVGPKTRIPVGIENVGGTLIRWQDFAEHAENALIDDALHSLRLRAEAFREAVS